MTPRPPTRVVRIRPSSWQRLILGTAALLALAAIALADLPTLGIGFAILFAAIVTWRAWARPHAVALRLGGDGRLEWRAVGQDWQPANLLPDSHVGPWLCVLSWRSQDSTYRLALYPDSLHPDDFRRLRTWLRWQARIEGDRPRRPPSREDLPSS